MPEKFYLRLEPSGMKCAGDRTVMIGLLRGCLGPVEVSVIHGGNGLCDMTMSSSQNILHGNVFLEIEPDRNLYDANGISVGRVPESARLAEGECGHVRIRRPDGTADSSLEHMDVYSEEHALKIIEAEKPFAVYYWTLAGEMDNLDMRLSETPLESMEEANYQLGGGTLDEAVGTAGAEVVSEVLERIDFRNSCQGKEDMKP